MTPAVVGAQLRTAMKRKHVTLAALSRDAGISVSALRMFRAGQSLPRLASAEAIASALDMPALSLAVVEMRTKTCHVCTAIFLDNSATMHAKFCGPSCRTVKASRVQRKRSAEYYGRLHVIARRRMDKYTRSVLAFCRACEPEGMCRRASCELRPVSPLPLKASAPSSTVARIAANRGGRSGSAGAA